MLTQLNWATLLAIGC